MFGHFSWVWCTAHKVGGRKYWLAQVRPSTTTIRHQKGEQVACAVNI
jgi:hypothetical protein